jgi:hypothetical protein
MNFWLRNILLGTLLIILAGAFFANQDFLLSLDHPANKLDSTAQAPVEKTAANTAAAEAQALQAKTESKRLRGFKKENAAAAGLTKFYTNIYGDMDSNGPKIRNNIIYLPEPKGNLEKLLQARGMTVRPYNKNWRGSIESRPFRKDETILQKLAHYSTESNIELIWWLNRDYIIKDPFRIEKNMLKTTYQVGKAIEGHFESGLSIYFCYQHRAVVIIESMPRPFLDEECILLGAENT